MNMNMKKILSLFLILATLFPLMSVGASASNISLPERYDARDYGLVTAVEKQISGTCWAHATIAALESNAIKKGLADNTLNLSEYHLVWNTQNGYYAGVTDSKNDGLSKPDFSLALKNGSTVEKAGITLSGFAGAVSEEKYPNNAETKEELIQEMKNRFSFANKYERDISFGETVDIGTDITEMKKAILEYGGLYYAFIYYSAGYSEYSEKGEPVQTYFRKDTTSTRGDHAVELIGWDDNFAVENFGAGKKPTKPGAWLLKDSKGADWGSDAGFFWISYEDPGLYSCVAVTAVPTSEYEKVFMYDGIGAWDTVSCTAAANVFTSDEDIALTKFSVGKEISGIYHMSVYLLNDGYKNPTDGKKLYTQSGTVNNKRYIDISETVTVSKGKKFSIVISGITSCYVEGANQGERKYTSNAGESYYYSNCSWVDSSTTANNNVCIRAIAKTSCIWEFVSSTKGADCKHSGVDTYVCTKCGETKTEPNNQYGNHVYSGSTCAVCGKSIICVGLFDNIIAIFNKVFSFIGIKALKDTGIIMHIH